MLVNGVELNVRVSGQGGVPLVWGHGLMGSIAADDNLEALYQWQKLAEQQQVVRYDARGHGQSQASPNLDDYHWVNLARDMVMLADGLGIPRFVAGGQSMGSATSLYAALNAPEHVRALVLMHPPTAWETRRAQSGFYEQMAAAIEQHGLAGLLDAEAAQSPAPAWFYESLPGGAGNLAQTFGTLNPQTLPLILRGAAQTDLPPRDAIRAITVPTLILAWEGDPGHPLSTAETLQSLITGSRLEVAHSMAELAQWPAHIRAFLAQLG